MAMADLVSFVSGVTYAAQDLPSTDAAFGTGTGVAHSISLLPLVGTHVMHRLSRCTLVRAPWPPSGETRSMRVALALLAGTTTGTSPRELEHTEYCVRSSSRVD